MKFKSKNKTKTINVLVLSVLVILTTQLILVNIVSAYVGSAVFCPNNFQPGTDTQNELQISQVICIYIGSMLDGQYSQNPYIRIDSSCTVSDYCNVLSTLHTSGSIDEIVVFSKGHRGLPYDIPEYDNNTNHISLLDHYAEDVKDHSHIYDNTSPKNTFTFLWHCETGEKYDIDYQNPQPPEDLIGYYGMPYCWTHNENMPCWGATEIHQVFLGWVDESPQFETPAEGAWNYGHVAYYFWYYVCNGYTVEEALDEIADYIFGDPNYLNSPPLYNKLLVWGDKSMGLPED